jgi:hypothetical protein
MQRDGITVTILRLDFDDLIGQNKTNAVQAYNFIFANIFTKVWEKCETVNPNVEKAFIQRYATTPSLSPPPSLPPPSSLPPPPPPPPTTSPPPPPLKEPILPTPVNGSINSVFTFGALNHAGSMEQAKIFAAQRQRQPNYDSDKTKLDVLTWVVANFLNSDTKKQYILEKINIMKDKIFPDKQIEYIKDLMNYLNLDYTKFENNYIHYQTRKNNKELNDAITAKAEAEAEAGKAASTKLIKRLAAKAEAEAAVKAAAKAAADDNTKRAVRLNTSVSTRKTNRLLDEAAERKAAAADADSDAPTAAAKKFIPDTSNKYDIYSKFDGGRRTRRTRRKSRL